MRIGTVATAVLPAGDDPGYTGRCKAAIKQAFIDGTAKAVIGEPTGYRGEVFHMEPFNVGPTPMPGPFKPPFIRRIKVTGFEIKNELWAKDQYNQWYDCGRAPYHL